MTTYVFFKDGSDATFPMLPIATTGTASAVLKTTATLNGTCNFRGAAGTAMFEYWNTKTPTVIISTPVQSFAAASTTYSVARGITGLASVTNYAYRVKCSNVSGPSTGATSVAFKTTR